MLKTSFDQIEIQEDGRIRLRLKKEADENGVVTTLDYHRAEFEPVSDMAEVDAYIGAINRHLEIMGFPVMPTAAVMNIKLAASAFWSEEVIAMHDQRRADEAAKAEEEAARERIAQIEMQAQRDQAFIEQAKKLGFLTKEQVDGTQQGKVT